MIQLDSQNLFSIYGTSTDCGFFQLTLLSATISSFENPHFPRDSAESILECQMITALSSIHWTTRAREGLTAQTLLALVFLDQYMKATLTQIIQQMSCKPDGKHKNMYFFQEESKAF